LDNSLDLPGLIGTYINIPTGLSIPEVRSKAGYITGATIAVDGGRTAT